MMVAGDTGVTGGQVRAAGGMAVRSRSLLPQLHQVLVQLQAGEKEQDFASAPIQVSISVQLWRLPGCHEFLAALGRTAASTASAVPLLKISPSFCWLKLVDSRGSWCFLRYYPSMWTQRFQYFSTIFKWPSCRFPPFWFHLSFPVILLEIC